MSTWNLTVTTKRTSFRFGGPDGNRISISGRGTLEFDESELRSKKASADDIASLLATTEHPITWELRDNVEWVESVLTDYVAFGHTRAAKIRGLLEGLKDRLAGLVVLDDSACLYVIAPWPEFEKLYELFVSQMGSNNPSPVRISFRGDFNVGLTQIDDHRPTASQLKAGAPLLSLWVEANWCEE